jgi:hypothetical protein
MMCFHRITSPMVKFQNIGSERVNRNCRPQAAADTLGSMMPTNETGPADQRQRNRDRTPLAASSGVISIS